MKTNEELQKKILDAIGWEPLLDAGQVGVAVKKGIVTLTGTVDNYGKKLDIENVVRKVAGVKAVVEQIDVDYDHSLRTDEAIAEEALEALKWGASIPEDQLQIIVSNGWIYLRGVVDWNYQKQSAQKVVEVIPGVKGIVNSIQIRSVDFDQIEKQNIENAFRRNSSLFDKNIKAQVFGNVVTLTGTVTAYFQKKEAERIVSNSPGVWTVKNLLVVEQPTKQEALTHK